MTQPDDPRAALEALIEWAESPDRDTFSHRYKDDGVVYTPYRVMAAKLRDLAAALSGSSAGPQTAIVRDSGFGECEESARFNPVKSEIVREGIVAKRSEETSIPRPRPEIQTLEVLVAEMRENFNSACANYIASTWMQCATCLQPKWKHDLRKWADQLTALASSAPHAVLPHPPERQT